MFKWFARFRKKNKDESSAHGSTADDSKDERLVLTHKIAIHRGYYDAKLGRRVIEQEGHFFYHLFETKSGRRRCSFACTISTNDLKADGERYEDWSLFVFPWLHGRYVPGIPSYEEVDALDVAKKLSEG